MGIIPLCNRIHQRLLRLIAPTLRHPQCLYEDVLTAHAHSQKDWLDIGCGHHILPDWRRGSLEDECKLIRDCRLVVGIDYDFASLAKHRSLACRVRGDITRLPFRADSFDLVTANMVVEHLRDPERQFMEISRILKPGGIFIFHTPNVLGYYVMLARLVPRRMRSKVASLIDTRPEEDVFPTFYQANSQQKIRQIAAQAGFESVQIQMIASSGEAALLLIPPLGLLQILWLRLLMTKPLRPLRTNIVAVLQKGATSAVARTAQQSAPEEQISDPPACINV